MLNGAHFMMNI